MQKTLLAFLGLTSSMIGAQNRDQCAPNKPVCYTQDPCKQCYFLGPDNIIANAPVCPRTCDGDFSISVAGFYWKAMQDGLEYAIDTEVVSGNNDNSATLGDIQNLVNAEYKTPNFNYRFGFKLEAIYCSPCDGWDLGIQWTRYNGSGSSKDEAQGIALRQADDIENDPIDNHVLFPLWSAFQSLFVFDTGSEIFHMQMASRIETHWKLDLDQVDLTLGRNFWVSPRLMFKPFIGLTSALIKQDFDLQHFGGVWSELDFPSLQTFQPDQNNEVKLKNDFSGIGIRGGFDSNWYLSCGFSLYSHLATSLTYGKFDISHDEINREAEAPFKKTKILDTKNVFRSTRALMELGLGVAYSALVCDCKYGFTAQFGWEEHIYFHQNQLWRVTRKSSRPVTVTPITLPNNTGENTFYQRRGNLSTQGWVLKIKLDF